MTMTKFLLLAATAAAACGSAAQAQFVFPAATLDGAGATLPATAQRQAFDCYGAKSVLAFTGVASASNPVTIADFNFPGTGTPITTFDCAARVVQPNIGTRFIGTGSGAGITAYLNHASPAVVFPAGFLPGNAQSYPYGVQYANSDNALSAANITAYNNAVLAAGTAKDGTTVVPAGTAASRYGAAIQVPIYIAPVAIDYSPVYAKAKDGAGNIIQYKFKVTGARADGSGGLKLSRANYCAILSGTITNWNQLPTTVVNKDPADPVAFNVPIVLAGRSESSGTTGLLTRALAAQCGGDYINSTTTLPAARVSGAVFNKGTTPTFTGTEVVGKYTVANGNDGVAQLVAYHPDPTTNGTRTLNGRIGYNGPDFTLPAVLFTGANTYGLNTASLQVNGTGTVYVGPTAKDAAAAFVGIAPPQSKGAAGAYCATTGCLVAGGSAVDASGNRVSGNRANPLHWIFPANKFLTDDAGTATATVNPLAIPTKGYPIMGTSNLLLYTCYADPATRRATDGVWANFIGKTTLDSTGTTAAAKIPAKLLTDAVKGVFAKNGLAAMPAAWTAAIAETFLKSSVQVGTPGVPTSKLGARGLWIQSKIPVLAVDNTEAKVFGNPACTGKPGA